MLNRFRLKVLVTILSLTLTACFSPPYNNFTDGPPNIKRTATGTGIGAITGALLGATVIGVAVGGAAGTAVGIYRANKRSIIRELESEDIQYIEYGDTITVIVPTDHYFLFNSAHLNEICFQGLNNLIKLLKFYPCSRIYIAAFTDNVGKSYHKRMLSQAQAETMLTFIWANGIKAELLDAKGYGDRLPIGNNKLIHGSAYNRRIEIQWSMVPDAKLAGAGSMGAMK